jgi:hypothetical protein
MKHKHADLIHAWADGAVIQRCYINRDNNLGWEDDEEPEWLKFCDYRIKPEQSVVRWQWAFEADVNTWEQYCRFMTEEEARARLASKFKYIKLEWTRTEFPE